MYKYPFICFFTLLSIAVSAQKTNNWRGGAPGHETEWSYFKNWSTGRVPNEFDHVIIPDVSTSTGKYPIISTGEMEVLSLVVQTGASLTLRPQARLIADDIEVWGTCKGCQERHFIAGNADTASVQVIK